MPFDFSTVGTPDTRLTPVAQDVDPPQAACAIARGHASQLFLAGNGLPHRWQGRAQFVILETGFGSADNFLATWDAWRSDPQRCARLSFIAVDLHLLSRADLTAAHTNSPWSDLARQLEHAWPPHTPNLHRLSFDNGAVELLLAVGNVQYWLPELVAEVDAFYLDGGGHSSDSQVWGERIFKALGRHAAPGAALAARSANQDAVASLRTAGFQVQPTVISDITLARYVPRFSPRHAVGRSPARPASKQRALIVGAGLAGCAAAWALAERGWCSTLFERHAAIATEASGNPAGLFHGTFNAPDSVHSRFNRAAALAARVAVQMAIDAHNVDGRITGLLRLESLQDLAAMQAQLDRLGLPADYLQALSAEAATTMSGLALSTPAWNYPGGGWVHPAGLARSFIERAGARARLRMGVDVQTIRRVADSWQLLDAHENVIDQSTTLVLANAGNAMRLLGTRAWPMRPVRGQISLLPASMAPHGLAACRVPITGAGYLLAIEESPVGALGIMFGATSQPDDLDAAVRIDDHVANLAQLQQLTGTMLDIDPAALQGRTGWRWSTPDRLPIIGAVPELPLLRGDATARSRWDQPRFVPREPGLFVFTALGSRGITWSALGAQVLASGITGTPVSLEASLLDAIDPARFISRGVRRAARG